MQVDFQIKKIYGSDIANYLEPIAKLRIKVFREYPYLYDGSWEYEKEYLDTYVQSQHSIAILAFANNEIVGASTALPLLDEMESLQKPFVDSDYSLDTIFYFGESVLLKEYRGKGLYQSFMKGREEHACSFQQYKVAAFCAVNRENNHPLRPEKYESLDSIWKKYGFVRQEDLVASLEWKEINEERESAKSLTFYLKDLDCKI